MKKKQHHQKNNFFTTIVNTVFTLILTAVMFYGLQVYSASSLKFAQVSDVHFYTGENNTSFKMIAESDKLLDDAVKQINETPNISFVMFTGDQIDKHFEKELRAMGITDAGLASMRKGYSVNGYNVHHKLPIHGGGKNEFSNFILTPLYPHDQWHKDVMDAQLLGIREGETRKIKIPWTDEMIYDPKQFGFTKENQPVKPNYTSNVNPANYPELYKPEHISVAKRQKDMAEFYASLDAKKAEGQKKQAPMKTAVRQIVRNRQRG